MKTIYRMPAVTRPQLLQLTLTSNNLIHYIDGIQMAVTHLRDIRLDLLRRHYPEIDLSKVESVDYSIVENAFYLKFKPEVK